MQSALYVGRVRHARVSPRPHAFDARVLMAWVDLAEWDEVFAGRWLWGTERAAPFGLRRRDFLSGPDSLDAAVRDRVEAESGLRPSGPIALLALPRSWGVGFRPVSFFYCFDPERRNVEAVVAEVTNTPWVEKHAYVLLPRGQGRLRRASAEKAFHVSPFFDMDLVYRFRFEVPGETLRLGIACDRDGRPVFDAHLALERRPIATASLARCAATHPFPTGGAVAAIYWHALRLALRGFPIFTHPAPGLAGREATDA